MPAHAEKESRDGDPVRLGEWSVVVLCPRGLPDAATAVVLDEVELELAILTVRLTAVLSMRFREYLDVRLDGHEE